MSAPLAVLLAYIKPDYTLELTEPQLDRLWKECQAAEDEIRDLKAVIAKGEG